MERRGSGIKKILKEYDEDELPQFYSDQQYFFVILKNKNYNKSIMISEREKLIYQKDKIGSEKSSVKTSEKILHIIFEDKYVTTIEMAKIIGISSRAVEKQLSKLKEKGVLIRVGADNGGHWEIVKDK